MIRVARELLAAIPTQRHKREGGYDHPAFVAFRRLVGMGPYRFVNPEEPAHEIAHWLVAHPTRRYLPEFGLDEFSKPYREEELASLLGILLEREYGLDWPHTLGEHEWHGEDHVTRVLWKLRWAGLIDQTGRPTVLRRDAL